MKKKVWIKYFFGVYKDYAKGIKVAQLCLTVDDLSCEILVDPGCLTFYTERRIEAIEHASDFAIQNGCTFLELNFEKYKIIKILKNERPNKRQT